MATLLDWSQVKNKVSFFKDTYNLQKDSDAFIYYALDRILKIDGSEIESCVTEGPNDRGIDAVYIESTTDKKTVHLFQMKCWDDFKGTDRNFPSNQIDKILSFLDDVLRKKEGLENSCNELLYSKICDIWTACETEPYSFHIHLCSNGSKLASVQREGCLNSIKKYSSMSLYEYDLETLAKIELGSNRKERSLTIRLYEEQNFERTDGFVKGLIGTIKASDFIQFLDDDNCPGKIDESLFEENIRLYLGEKNDVNVKIFHSALSDNPSEFWYLNNGITIVCDTYKYQRYQSNAPVQIKNPQIVNGGQTSYSLYEAKKRDPAKLENIRVLVKVIETEDNAFRNKIAEATNSQTPIRSRDLRSNDSIQLKLEEGLQLKDYAYDRKRNQNLGVQFGKRIDALKLGQIILSYVLKEPEKAKSASEKIFGEYYEWVFDPHSLTVEKAIAYYRIFHAIELRRILVVQSMRTRLKAQYSEEWLVEGAFHVLYMIGLLCERDDIPLDDIDRAVSKLDEAVQIVGGYVKKQKKASAYRIFRTIGTKNYLKTFTPAKQIELPFGEEAA